MVTAEMNLSIGVMEINQEQGYDMCNSTDPSKQS